MAAKAILIGCGRYAEHGILPLQFAEQDAEALSRRLIDPDIGGYAAGDVNVLTSPDHRTAAILLARVIRSAGPEDSLLFYFAGHGLRDENGQLHLAMSDSDPELLEVTSIPARQVREILDSSRSRQICVILDCCFSGAIGSRGGASPADVTQSVSSLGGEGTVILTSAQPTQEARERPDLGHGVFTKYLLDGIDGEADADGDGVITPLELYNYVAVKMEQDVGRTQRPTFKSNLTGGLFPLVRSSSRRSKALNLLTDEIERLCEEKRHGEALERLRDFREAGPGDRQGLQAIHERVEQEKRSLVSELRRKALEAAGRNELLDTTLQAVLDRLAKDSNAVFVARPKEITDRILRNYLTDRLDANLLQDSWPHPVQGGREAELAGPMPTPEEPEAVGTPAGGKEGRHRAADLPGKAVEARPTALRRMFSRAAIGLAVLAAAAAVWIVVDKPAATGPKRLRVGVLLKRGWNPEKAKAVFEVIAGKLASELKGNGDFRPEVGLYTDAHAVRTALGNGGLDLAGELSPHDIFEAQQAGARPFVTALYEGKQHYKAVIFVPKGSRLMVPNETKEVKAGPWERVLQSLRDGTGRLAVGDKTSMSGYWVPRSILLEQFRRREWRNLSFGDVAVETPDVLRTVACGEQLVVAGVIARFKLPSDGWTLCDQQRVEIATVYESGGILNGGYVASAKIAGDGPLLSALKDGWMNAASALTEEERGSLGFPAEWSRVDETYYEPMNRMIMELDDVEMRRSRDQRIKLSAAALILMLCAAAYFLLPLSKRRVLRAG